MIYKKVLLFMMMFMTSVLWSADLSIYPLTSTWKDEHNQDFSLKELQGKKVIVAMAYTSCQGSCPMIVGKLKKIESLFNEKKTPVEVVVITFDPSIDTPERHFAFYREKMGLKGPNWHFLSGAETDTRKISMLLGIKYAKNPRSGMIIHDNKIVLLNPQGEVEKRIEDLNQDEKTLAD